MLYVDGKVFGPMGRNDAQQLSVFLRDKANDNVDISMFKVGQAARLVSEYDLMCLGYDRDRAEGLLDLSALVPATEFLVTVAGDSGRLRATPSGWFILPGDARETTIIACKIWGLVVSTVANWQHHLRLSERE